MILQVLLFDQLQLLGVRHPYIYVLCLLMMPITLSHSADMIIGAVVGLIMDIFCNSMGIHTAACIFIMFIRPYLIGAIVNDKDRLNEQISLRSLGMEALLRYVVILVVIHHLIVFLLAAWNWAHIGFVLVETLVSSLVTISIIIGYNSLRYR
jgi:rod shape-determining protein MreD